MLRSRARRGAVRAIDTNVVVRLLVDDDHRQAKAARKLIAEHEVFVPVTVVLETEWVMRSGYGFTPSQIAAGLRRVGGLPEVTIERPGELAQALEWMDQGMDFADALHLAQAMRCERFVTFDRKLAKRAKGLAAPPVEVL